MLIRMISPKFLNFLGVSPESESRMQDPLLVPFLEELRLRLVAVVQAS